MRASDPHDGDGRHSWFPPACKLVHHHGWSIFCQELAAPSEGTSLRALPCASLGRRFGGWLLQALLDFQPDSLDGNLALLKLRAELELQFRMLLDQFFQVLR